jgi:putative FmdB family regulatory protein
MPLYDYECDACDARCTLLLTHAERESPVTCATCGTKDLRRVLSTFAVRSTSRFSPRSGAERLAGPGVKAGTGTEPSSVLGHSH